MTTIAAPMATAAYRCAGCGAALPAVPLLQGRDRLHGTPGTFDVVVCRECGSGLTLPVVADDALGAFYPSSYNAYALPDNRVLKAAATLLFRWRYRRALRRSPLGELARRPPGRLLDVGGGRGDLGVIVGPRGWRVTSLDPSPTAVEEARSRGVHSMRGTLTAPDEELEGGYDAIVFQHSLEHVVDVEANLRAAYALLADGGVVLLALPNFGCWQRRRFGADWFHLDLPRHRSHLTARGLEAALTRAGFADVRLATATSADGLPTSIQYRLLGGRPRRASMRLLATTAGLLLAPLTAALDRAAGAGDILEAVAVRPPPA